MLRSGIIILALLMACGAPSDAPVPLDHELTSACLSEGDCAESSAWVLIPSGSFEMGAPEDEEGFEPDEGPLHPVTITRAFAATKVEITQSEWARVMENHPSFFSDCGDTCPTEQISLWEALAYCNVRSKQEELEACYELSACQGTPGSGFECQSVQFTGLDCEGYRIPTEAEWEYMARAGSADPRYDVLDEIAWCTSAGSKKTHPVAELSPNAWGLYDVYGNVHEWVWDHHAANYYDNSGLEDPTGPESGFLRLSRGGSWNTNAAQCRAASRTPRSPTNRLTDLGFRVVRSRPLDLSSLIQTP